MKVAFFTSQTRPTRGWSTSSFVRHRSCGWARCVVESAGSTLRAPPQANEKTRDTPQMRLIMARASPAKNRVTWKGSMALDRFGLEGQIIDGQVRVEAVIGEGGVSVVYKG